MPLSYRRRPLIPPVPVTRPPTTSTHASSTPRRLAVWLSPLALMGAIAGAILILRSPWNLFPWVLGFLLAVALLWVLVSSLYPGKPDRRCPACGQEALERAEASSTRGLTCSHCLWSDPDASSFLLAEEEGALDDLLRNDRVSPEARRPAEVAR